MKIVGMTNEHGRRGLVGLFKVESNSYIIYYMNHETERCEFICICISNKLKSYETDDKLQRDELYDVVCPALNKVSNNGWLTLCINDNEDFAMLLKDKNFVEDHGVIVDRTGEVALSVEYAALLPWEVSGADTAELYKQLRTVTSTSGWCAVTKSWMNDIQEEMKEEELEEQYV